MTNEDYPILGDPPALPDDLWDRLLVGTFEAAPELGDIALIPDPDGEQVADEADDGWAGFGDTLEDPRDGGVDGELDGGDGHWALDDH